jgi:hypothetical protein
MNGKTEIEHPSGMVVYWGGSFTFKKLPSEDVGPHKPDHRWITLTTRRCGNADTQGCCELGD